MSMLDVLERGLSSGSQKGKVINVSFSADGSHAKGGNIINRDDDRMIVDNSRSEISEARESTMDGILG